MALFRRFPASKILSCLVVPAVLSLAHPGLAAEDDEQESSGKSDGDDDNSSKADDGDSTEGGDEEGDSGKKKKGKRSKKSSDDESDDESDEEEESEEEKGDFGHMGQFGLRAAFVGGFRMIFRYDDSPYCTTPDPLKAANNQRKVCGHAAPFAVDLAGSFALLDFLEPFAWVRLGLGAEKQTDTKPVVILGVGARLYMTSQAMFKVFIEPAVAYEMEGGRGTPAWQANEPEYSRDIVFHLAAGPQVDFSKNVGGFLTGGVTTGVVRAIHNSLDLALGVQGRFP